MKYVDGFRNRAAADVLRQRIGRLAAGLKTGGRRVSIMEVCGSHTQAIARHGIRDILPDNVDLISGPGCPVCVTPASYIDAALNLAANGITVVSFGDLIHVPGSVSTLADGRARGGSVEVGYSPGRALDLAAAHPEREVVFLAVGFETTTAPVMAVVEQAIRRGLGNLSFLTAFKCVPPVLEALLADPDVRIDAFLCPAHVSAIIGADVYGPLAKQYHVPCVVAGFEPLDVLLGLNEILEQVARGDAQVVNLYARVVKAAGNERARALMAGYLEPVDAIWRGLGLLPASGLGFRAAFARYDAACRYGLTIGAGDDPPGCACGDVLKGKRRPAHCPLFGAACTPDHAVGPCMVSAEGACAAAFKYGRVA